jgi:hypothetical protein
MSLNSPTLGWIGTGCRAHGDGLSSPPGGPSTMRLSDNTASPEGGQR